jgi:hypothetical protein
MIINLVESLTKQHAKLDAEIQREQTSIRPDMVRIATLKRNKLRIKDRLNDAMHRMILRPA